MPLHDTVERLQGENELLREQVDELHVALARAEKGMDDAIRGYMNLKDKHKALIMEVARMRARLGVILPPEGLTGEYDATVGESVAPKEEGPGG